MSSKAITECKLRWLLLCFIGTWQYYTLNGLFVSLLFIGIANDAHRVPIKTGVFTG